MKKNIKLPPEPIKKQMIVILDQSGHTITPVQIDLKNGIVNAAWYIDGNGHKVWLLSDQFKAQIIDIDY